MQKTCSKCFEKKDVSLFHKDKTSSSGLSSACKSCRNELRRRGFVGRVLDAPVEGTKLLGAVEGQENPYKKLSDKHGSFYTISVSSSGKCQIQVFKDSPIILRCENFDVEGLLASL